MCPPTRYTASKPSVKSTRLRRSATAKMFFRLSASMCVYRRISRPARQVKAPAYRRLRQHLGPAASRRDLFRRLAAELVRLHRERLADVATCQNLDIPRPAHQTVL